MMINSIQLCNFGCYKDTHPAITFSTDVEKNVTVILGANKSGKTTLVKAFLWCLYGEVSPKIEVINIEAKTEMAILSAVDVFVEIILIHAGKEYTVRRTQRFYRETEQVRSDDSVLKVQYKEASGEQQSVSLRDCADTVNNILPKGLSDYFFYEGERFDDISKKDVATAVRGLMGLDAISEARKHLDPKRAISVTSYFGKLIGLDNEQEGNKLKQNLENCKNEREAIIERIETAKKEHDYYLHRKEELEKKLSQNEIAKTLQQKRKTLENDIKIIQSNIERTAKRIFFDFQRGALAFFALPLIDRALAAFRNLEHDVEGITGMRQDAIDFILERKRCICGCDLHENEGARKNILAERRLLPPEYLGTIVHDHKQTLLGYRSSSKDFVEEINSNHVNWRKNIHYLEEKNEDLTNVGSEIIATGSIDVESIEIEYQKNEKELDELSKRREKLREDKGAIERDIDNFEKSIVLLVEKNENNNKLQRYINYAETLFKWFDTSYSQREQEVKTDLTESVNRIFSEMYHGHRIVKIDENYQIKLLVSIGVTQKELSETGGIRPVKNFAYITGLVDIARKRAVQRNGTGEIDEEYVLETEPYPLVMDAPFSGIDEKHIDNISRIIPGIAEQVIIMSMQKDWIHAKSSIEKRVGKRYVIENIDNSETCSKIWEGE